MSLVAHASGILVGDPQRRQGAKAEFALASLKVDSGGDSILVRLIGFGGKADDLLDHAAGEPLSVAGRVEVSAWLDRTGAPRPSVKIIVEAIMPLKPKRQTKPGPRAARASQTSFPLEPTSPLPDDRLDDLYAGVVP